MFSEILSFGEPMYEFSQIKQSQAMQPDFLSGFGGDVSNFAIAAARQGANVGMITHLGADEFGEQFKTLWQRESVALDLVESNASAHTGVYFITHNEEGHHFSFLRKGSAASLISKHQLPVEAIANAKLLHTTAITQAISDTSCDAVFAAIELARKTDTLVSYDTNLRLKLWSLNRAKAIINETISQVDICFPSIDEAQLLTGLTHADEIIDHYLTLGAKIVVLKQGSEGATVADQHARFSIKPHKVTAVDATAAGDSFAGSFCTHYVRGAEIQDCLKYANATASITITGYGAVAPLPTLAQVEQRLNLN
ncbi:sugar kinase [Agarivorans sp. Toyoura001]|uniref:sugar kinase n=1 Tax=unclassified Agarivorans TaxID=2636026 RepID=UPI0010E1CC32|nr:sugar kinase [Agarivorans sp. Toyoura001]GDY25133.1 2-dehydro-3-deoxygluconokinase [Agarivorans sp. Toyoura001]